MREFVVQEKLMGCAFELLVVHKDEATAQHLLTMGIDEIKRIEKLLSEFLPASETSLINQNAHQSFIPVSDETFGLIERSLAISSLSNGCFDITVGALKKLYNFKNTSFELPSQELIQETLKRVGFDNIELNSARKAIKFKRKDLKISFAAIGKGYASDRVKKLWLQQGLTSGYVNASGDLNAFGTKPDGSNWKIGIANPDNKEENLFYIPVQNTSVATSGDYEQHFNYQGKRYSHNINPHTGLPLTGIKSVTVFSQSAELSDALATAVYVMGTKDGIEFINQLPHTHAIIIDDKQNAFFSKEMNYETV